MKVLLVSAPFAAVDRPALGLSLLKAGLQVRGVGCDVAYLTVAFAEAVGREAYELLVNEVPATALACEWVFKPCLFDDDGEEDEYVEDVLVGQWRLPASVVDAVTHARSRASIFLEAAFQRIDWNAFDVIGFTTVGQQNVASLALARRIKERFARPVIVFGGPGWEGPMGREQLRLFTCVDGALSGEADVSFPAFVSALAAGATPPGVEVAGLTHRARGGVRSTPEARAGGPLAEAPLPDHSEYFAARRGCSQVAAGPLVLPVEASRGCWWAGRGACRFCGMSGGKGVYRTKSAGAVLEEIRSHAREWPGARVDLVDNVVPDAFLDVVLPELASSPLPVSLSFAVRPGVREDHIRDAAACGARLQCGLESLSDGLLKRMHKGARGLENVRTLKWCREHGLAVAWNMLYAVPGECADDYRQMVEALPAIHFLPPPQSCGPVQLERHSRYHARPGSFGLRNVRPARAYSYVYPFSRATLGRLAYFFDFNQPAEADRPGHVLQLRAGVAAWQRDTTPGDLRIVAAGEDKLTLEDTREGERLRRLTLQGRDAVLYAACADICDLRRLCELCGAGDAGEAGDVRRRLDSMVRRKLMVTEAGRYLSLALGRSDCRFVEEPTQPDVRPLPGPCVPSPGGGAAPRARPGADAL